jgi:PhoH-like ATPase
MATKRKSQKRTFVLDTNVLIHDPNAIYSFDEHDVVIPITVVEELDKLKRGEESRNVSARQASRNLTKLIKEGESSTSISLGNGKGNLTFFVFEKYPTVSAEEKNSFRNIFLEDCADHRIIAVAYMLKEKGEDVTIVTKDNNVLIKATALSINAEDYTHDMVRNPEQLTEKIREIDPEDLEVSKKGGGTKDLELYLNQPVMVKGCSDGQDHIYRWQGKSFDLIKREEIGKTKIKPKNLEQDFAVDILMDPDLSAIALIGSAGSGKTLLAIACAISQRDEYDRILVARPAIELSNKTMGFLPGNLEEKYNPYLAPVRSACRFIMDKMETEQKRKEAEVAAWMDDHGIELLPLSMIRGDTFHHAFILVDEAQNLTPNEVKTIVSRAGEDTKIVFTGDINQIDVQYLTKETSGLSHLIERFRGQKYFAFIEMQKSVRSPLAEAADKLL